MPNYNIDRARFLELINQFKGDIPYLHKLFTKVSEMLPEEYFKQLVADLFHQYIYDKSHYVAEHHLFSGQKHYFLTLEELQDFLQSKNLEKEFPIKKNKVQLAMDTRLPIAGYYISFINKEDIK
jgi:hypothetical protein